MGQAATELCWLTCASSDLNGEELIRSSGVRALARLLQRCLSVIPIDVAPHVPAAVITTNVLRALAGMASFPSAAAQLLDRCASTMPIPALL